jgi:hypothetical protein
MHGFECNLDKTCSSEFFKDLKIVCYLRSLKTHVRMFIQISRETMLLLINNLHKNKIHQLCPVSIISSVDPLL